MRWWWRGVAAGAGLALALGGPGCSLVREHDWSYVPPTVERGGQVGIASWYGPGFHGNRTANGEIFDQNELTAAHRSLPLGTRVMVTNLNNGRSVEVRINDRGPYVDGRCIDLSYAAARSLAMIGPGTAKVRIEVLGQPPRPPAVAAAATAPAQWIPPPEHDLPTATYAVQVASLTDPDKAEHLREVLSRRFPEAFVSPFAGRYYRVRIGPYPLRGVALARAELVSRLGYPAVIMEADEP